MALYRWTTKTADFKQPVDRRHCEFKEKINVFCHNSILMQMKSILARV